MSPRIAIALLAASLLAPVSALAAGPAAIDDVQYPNVHASFATRSDVIDTSDFVYPSTLLTVTNALSGREGAFARVDDVTYPTADEPALAARPALRVARAPDPDASLPCHCAPR